MFVFYYLLPPLAFYSKLSNSYLILIDHHRRSYTFLSITVLGTRKFYQFSYEKLLKSVRRGQILEESDLLNNLGVTIIVVDSDGYEENYELISSSQGIIFNKISALKNTLFLVKLYRGGGGTLYYYPSKSINHGFGNTEAISQRKIVECFQLLASTARNLIVFNNLHRTIQSNPQLASIYNTFVVSDINIIQ